MPGFGKTKKFTLTTVATAITASTWCRQITIQEDLGVAGWPTTDYLIARPTSTDDFLRVAGGVAYVFTFGGFDLIPNGAVVGYAKTVSGSTTFQQTEDP